MSEATRKRKRHHDLKTWPEPWGAVERGEKTAEFRKDDRDFKVGDILWLHEWNPETEIYTGRCLTRVITDIRRAGLFGIPEGYAMLSIRPVADDDIARLNAIIFEEANDG